MTRRRVGSYVKDGRPTTESDNHRKALRFLRRLYGVTSARSFGPLALKAVRKSMIEGGRSRKAINKDVHRIRAKLRWAVVQELYPGEASARLGAVEVLRFGRIEAKERPPMALVPEGAVVATLPQVASQDVARADSNLSESKTLAGGFFARRRAAWR
jgi:hypothetical protein